jgi:hypothetical protein
VADAAVEVRIGAQTADLRAQLAIAERGVQQLGRSLREAADDARSSGSGVTDAMRRIAAELEAARASSANLGKELKDSLATPFAALTNKIREPLEAVRNFNASLSELAELAAAAFAVEKIADFSKEMAEAGEHALNTGFALGLTTDRLAELQALFVLAGGDADEATRSMERLGLSVQKALQQPTGEAATAFKNLGISMATVRANANDLPALLEIIGGRIRDAAERNQALAVAQELVGRGINTLVPLFRLSAEQLAELKEKSEDYKRAVDDATPAEAAEAEQLNELKLSAMTLAHDGFLALQEPIRLITELLQGLVTVADKVAQAFRAIGDAEAWMENRTRQAFQDLAGVLGWHPDFLKLGTAPTNPPPGSNQIGTAEPGAGHKGKADNEDAEIAKDLDREILEETQQRIAALDAEKQAADIDFNSQIAHLQALVREGKLTADEGMRQEQALTVAKWSADEDYLQQKLDLYDDDAKGIQRVQDEELVQTAQFNAKMQEITDRTAELTKSSWSQMVTQLSDQFAKFAEDVLLRTTSISKAFDEMMKSIIGDLLKSNIKNLFQSMFGGGSGGGGGGSGGGGLFGGIGSFLGGQFSNLLFGSQGLGGALFGSGGLSGALGVGSSGLLGGAIGSILGTGSGAAADASFAGAIGAGTGAIGGGGTGGVVGSLLPMLQAAPALTAAAGGWVVPSFASGGILSVLHQNEMVLPSHLSQFVQDSAANASGGGGAPMNITVQALDGASAHRVLMANAPSIMAAFNRAARNGVAPRIRT